MRLSLSMDSSGAYLALSVLHIGLLGQLLDEEASSEPDAASGLAHHFELWEIRESGAPWEPVQIEDLAGGILLLYHGWGWRFLAGNDKGGAPVQCCLLRVEDLHC